MDKKDLYATPSTIEVMALTLLLIIVVRSKTYTNLVDQDNLGMQIVRILMKISGSAT